MPRPRPSIWHLYFTIYNGKKCFDTRGLRRRDVLAAPSNGVADRTRDYTACLGDWQLLSRLKPWPGQPRLSNSPTEHG
jgi:hypothetical protein